MASLIEDFTLAAQRSAALENAVLQAEKAASDLVFQRASAPLKIQALRDRHDLNMAQLNSTKLLTPLNKQLKLAQIASQHALTQQRFAQTRNITALQNERVAKYGGYRTSVEDFVAKTSRLQSEGKLDNPASVKKLIEEDWLPLFNDPISEGLQEDNADLALISNAVNVNLRALPGGKETLDASEASRQLSRINNILGSAGLDIAQSPFKDLAMQLQTTQKPVEDFGTAIESMNKYKNSYLSQSARFKGRESKQGGVFEQLDRDRRIKRVTANMNLRDDIDVNTTDGKTEARRLDALILEDRQFLEQGAYSTYLGCVRSI